MTFPLPWFAAFDWQELLPILFFVIYGIVHWLGSRRKAADESQENEAAPDEEEARERARRIQEEIRRRIAERQQQQDPHSQPAPQPQPTFQPRPPAHQPQPIHPAPYSTPPPQSSKPLIIPSPPQTQKQRFDGIRDAREAAEQLQDDLTKAAEKESRNFWKNEAANLKKDAEATGVVKDLLHTDGARRAILLAEIIGPPAANRDGFWDRA